MADTPGVPGRFSLNTSAQTCTPGNRTLLRYLADSRFLIVDRVLQLPHDLAQSLQCLVGFALPAQDHEIVGVGHNARTEAHAKEERCGPADADHGVRRLDG